MGYVYAMDNPCFRTMPSNDLSSGLVAIKIGMTTKDPVQRAKELSNTSVPTPFEVVWAVYVADEKRAEYFLHQSLSPHRVTESREFFWMNPDTLRETLNERIETHLSDPALFMDGFEDDDF